MRIKFILLFLLALVTGLVSSSQSVYQFRYKFSFVKDTITYRSVFIRLYDGSGIFRIRYTDPSSRRDVLIEMDAEELQGTDTAGVIDTSSLNYRITNQRTIWGTGKLKYNSLLLIYKYNPVSDFFEPSGIRPALNLSRSLQDSFLFSKLMLKQELTIKFIGGFFSEDEEYFRSLSYESATKGLSAAERKIKLHLIIVADTLDKEIAKACSLDVKKVIETFDALVLKLGIQKSYNIVAGSKFNVKSVWDAVKNIRLFSPNDIIIFYYTGHGFRKREERDQKIHFPYMKLKTDGGTRQEVYTSSINIQEIFSAIKKVGARFNLVISDCCNEDVLSSKSFGTRIGKVKSSGMDWSIDNCKSLFLRPMSILATAADNGQRAAGNIKDGSFFTQFFKMTLETNLSRLNTTPSWDKVLTDAKEGTIKFAKTAPCPRENDPSNKCFQEPYYIIR